jgi:uncharacterized protein YbaP (TraB family)
MNKATLIFISFFFTLFIYAQNHPKTLLWKVTKKGSVNKSYLFGTFHEVNPSFFNRLSNAINKLQQSDFLFVEQRSSPIEKLRPGDKIIWNFEKWKTILTKDQEEVFAAFLNKAEDTSYYKLSPILLSLTMARLYFVNFCEIDSDANDELMDTYIEKFAGKKAVYSLDSNQNTFLNKTAEKLSILQDSQYASYGIHYMKSMLDNNLSDCAITSAYKNFEIDYKLNTELNEKSADYLLLIIRNNSWISILDKAFSFNNCFVAVGFKHLFYKQGLIQKLRNLGYDVTPIPVML